MTVPDGHGNAGQLEDALSDASFFTRRGMRYPSFGSHGAVKELRRGHAIGTRALTWNATGDALISCGHDKIARVWHPERTVCMIKLMQDGCFRIH